MLNVPLNQKLHFALRVAAAMCFIGHGSFGIITKPIWCNYFAVFGIDKHFAYQLMPIVGCIDIACGIAMLAYPLKIIPAWLVVWGFVTALLRPLSGEPFAEFIERAGNYGAPLALLILAGMPRNFGDLFTRANPHAQPGEKNMQRLANCLKILSFLLLLGHGGLNLTEKKSLLDQYTSMGFSDPARVAQIVGMIEILSAFTLLIRPFRLLIFALFIWKMSSELFYPHRELFEWIERGGSYGVLMALWLIAERETLFSWYKKRDDVRPTSLVQEAN